MTRIVTHATKHRLAVPAQARRFADETVVGMAMELPEPPSANRYWRSYRGRVVVSTEARAYKAGVWSRAVLARHRPFAKDVPVSVTLHWHRAKRMGDLDNRIKVTLDALRGVLYDDDKQVVAIHAYRVESARNGKLSVKVERVPGPGAAAP